MSRITGKSLLRLGTAVAACLLAFPALANIPKKSRPSNAETIYAEAAGAFREGKYAEALKLAAELAEKEGASERQIGLKAEILLETGRHDDAEKTLMEAGIPSLAVLLARAEMARGKYRQAAERLKKRLAEEPLDFKARRAIFEVAGIIGDPREQAVQRRYITNLARSGGAKSFDALIAIATVLKRRSPKAALRAAEEAAETAPDPTDALLAAADVCLENFAWSKAERLFKKVLAKNPKNPSALLGMAWLAFYNGDLRGTERHARMALETNPDLVGAYVALADAEIVSNRMEKALEYLRKGEAINPSAPEILDTMAAYHDAAGNSSKRDGYLKKALSLNKYDPEPYNTIADLAQSRNRVEEAAKWARKAIEINPSDWHGRFLLGTSLVRLGEERAGREELARSFEMNPFNIFAYNILQALDQDFVRHRFEKFETEHFVVKIPKEDADAIWPGMERFIEETYARITKKYRFNPKGPKEYGGKVLIEIMPDHESFSARTIGLPGIQASGVCFGQVVLIPSPRQYCLGEGPGLDIKSVFEHEFNHVVTVQQSRYGIPRWLTEGLSSWEERDEHPTWASALGNALSSGKARPLEDLDSGFLRPTYPAEVAVSYYQANLACRYIADKYGFDKIIEMIELSGEGKPTAEFVEEATGKKVSEINRELEAFYAEDAEKRRKTVERAMKTLDEIKKGLKLDEKKTPAGGRNWKPMIDELIKKKDFASAEKALLALIAVDDSDYHLHKALGRVEMRLGHWKRAVEAFSNAIDRNPFDKKTRDARAEALKKAGAAGTE